MFIIFQIVEFTNEMLVREGEAVVYRDLARVPHLMLIHIL